MVSIATMRAAMLGHIQPGSFDAQQSTVTFNATNGAVITAP